MSDSPAASDQDDEQHRKFREALERKKAAQHDAHVAVRATKGSARRTTTTSAGSSAASRAPDPTCGARLTCRTRLTRAQ